jgi:hypothetical protein
MEYAIGIALALAVLFAATQVGLDRDRAFYPTVMIVIASYYGLFAVMGGSVQALMMESVAIAVFVLIAVLGFKTTPWWVVGALAAHGAFDFVHGALITDPGVPSWWPGFCATFDLTAAAYLAWLLHTGKIGAPAAQAAGT